jgi:hypothetical protein
MGPIRPPTLFKQSFVDPKQVPEEPPSTDLTSKLRAVLVVLEKSHENHV